MVNAIERPEDINRHANGGRLSPKSERDFHTSTPVFERGLNLNKRVFLYKHQQNELPAVEFRIQNPPIFLGLQKKKVYPRKRVLQLKKSVPVCEECPQAYKMMFKSSNQHWSFTTLVFT
jgi:hypothetical protein